MSYYYCGDCVYFGIDMKTIEVYCGLNHPNIHQGSNACDDFVFEGNEEV